jgi:pyruvate/2-oxoglutarate dehydrogenase complex dihydrolipoamide acyltransferase (E2) component
MKTIRQFLFLTILLTACGETEAAPAEPVAAAPAAPAPAAAAPAPTPAAPAAAPAAPAPAAAAPAAGSPEAGCAAYYDETARRALADAERGATEHPGLDVRSALGVGERATFIAQCAALPEEQRRCFGPYAAAHMDECLPFILSPPPTFVVQPLNNLSLEDLRALVAALPPAT